jgi:hypothetical protein
VRFPHAEPGSVENDAGPYLPWRAKPTRAAPNKADSLKC